MINTEIEVIRAVYHGGDYSRAQVTMWSSLFSSDLRLHTIRETCALPRDSLWSNIACITLARLLWHEIGNWSSFIAGGCPSNCRRSINDVAIPRHRMRSFFKATRCVCERVYTWHDCQRDCNRRRYGQPCTANVLGGPVVVVWSKFLVVVFRLRTTGPSRSCIVHCKLKLIVLPLTPLYSLIME